MSEQLTDLDRLLASLPDDDSIGVQEWFTASNGFTAGTEGETDESSATRPRTDDPRAIRRIGIVGGGTAGYLTALALRAKRPWLEVTLVESTGIPIIGVGEATTPSMVPFLHHYLGIDAEELYREVAPTWKLGIRFDWGPKPAGFMAPFDWGSNSIGVLGSIASQGDINAFTLQSLLMAHDRAPVFAVGNGEHVSLMNHLPYAYHLDNARFVRYLTKLARRRGVHHLDATVDQVVLNANGWVDHLVTTDNQKIEFDAYVDCSGFRSLLLGKALDTPYVPFTDSLKTDRAITAVVPHHGAIKPYTRATTMDAGWCWTIPTRTDDHVGYVHSSQFIDEAAATAELQQVYPDAHSFKTVRFRSGRHQDAWRGNVIAIGNSYAFVEPLESSGLMMITLGIMSLVGSLPGSWDEPCPRAVVNAALAKKWDEIRWFLSLHYRFNTRKDTEFWVDARANTDVSGLQPLLEVYAGGAPLRFRDPIVRGFLESTAPTFYGLDGVDCLLLGQEVPTKLLPQNESSDVWAARKASADALVARALPAELALKAFDLDPQLNTTVLRSRGSWAGPRGTERIVAAEPIGATDIRAESS